MITAAEFNNIRFHFPNYVIVSEDYVKVSNSTSKYFMCLGLEPGFGSQGAITTLNVAGVCISNSYLLINIQKVILLQCDIIM